MLLWDKEETIELNAELNNSVTKIKSNKNSSGPDGF